MPTARPDAALNLNPNVGGNEEIKAILPRRVEAILPLKGDIVRTQMQRQAFFAFAQRFDGQGLPPALWFFA